MTSCLIWSPMKENEDVVVVTKRKERSESVHGIHADMCACCCNATLNYGARSTDAETVAKGHF